MIKKQGSQYVIKSHTGKTLGSYTSKTQAEKRLKQIEFYKNHPSNKGGKAEEVGPSKLPVGGFNFKEHMNFLAPSLGLKRVGQSDQLNDLSTSLWSGPKGHLMHHSGSDWSMIRAKENERYTFEKLSDSEPDFIERVQGFFNVGGKDDESDEDPIVSHARNFFNVLKSVFEPANDPNKIMDWGIAGGNIKRKEPLIPVRSVEIIPENENETGTHGKNDGGKETESVGPDSTLFPSGSKENPADLIFGDKPENKKYFKFMISTDAPNTGVVEEPQPASYTKGGKDYSEASIGDFKKIKINKELYEKNDLTSIFLVDGGEVRNKCDIDFLGGASWTGCPSYVPVGETWIEKNMSDRDALIVHEMTELKLMLDGISYQDAHEMATEEEAKFRSLHKANI